MLPYEDMQVLFEQTSLYLTSFISILPFGYSIPEKIMPIIVILIVTISLLFLLRTFLKAIILIPVLIIITLGYLWLTKEQKLPSQNSPTIDAITEQFNI
jgi:hypothetical protein